MLIAEKKQITLSKDGAVCTLLIAEDGTLLCAEGCLSAIKKESDLPVFAAEVGLNEGDLAILKKLKVISEYLELNKGLRYSDGYLRAFGESYPYGALVERWSIQACVFFRHGRFYTNLYASKQLSGEDARRIALHITSEKVFQGLESDEFPEIVELAEEIRELMTGERIWHTQS